MSMNTDFFNAVAQVVDDYKLDRIRFFYDIDNDDCCLGQDKTVSFSIHLDFAESKTLATLEYALHSKLEEVQKIHKYPYKLKIYFGSLYINDQNDQESSVLQFAKEQSKCSSPTGNVFVVE